MKEIAVIQMNAVEDIHVALNRWKSDIYCDIRVWFKVEPGADGDIRPTTKGLRFNAELLPDLRSAIDEAIRVIENGENIGTTREEMRDGR